ncbi:unnamed protein product [Lepeophtheirus salmonis]|uniref:(salmon louse) hypothetical protein n=1 Tax=Lepeophtheirus salmonis TaxID=72036 RepID=A0A7R8HCK1_LEPSM|nr:unnamed protein product [Lepeophtheirus salmonis]CAF2993336.1 unnamed protein product [Lepeophtheirus salmonis]
MTMKLLEVDSYVKKCCNALFIIRLTHHRKIKREGLGKTEKGREEKTIRLAGGNTKLRESPIKRLSIDDANAKEAREMEDLNMIFCLWPDNLEELMKNNVD